MKQLTDGADNEQVTALTPTGETAVAELMEMMAGDAGTGEHFDPKELPTQFLSILQTNSPQVDEGSMKHVEGAKPGMLFNNVTEKIIDVRVIQGRPDQCLPTIICGSKLMFTEWIPDRGGFVGQHLPNSAMVLGAKPHPTRRCLENSAKNELVETDYNFVITVEDEFAPKALMLGMVSTQLKTISHLRARIDEMKLQGPNGQFRPKRFQLVFEVRTVQQKNAKGTWWGWDFTYVDVIPRYFTKNAAGIYAMAKKQYEDVMAGIAKVGAPPTEVPEGTGADKDVPF